jgi:hypothetical protein
MTEKRFYSVDYLIENKIRYYVDIGKKEKG